MHCNLANRPSNFIGMKPKIKILILSIFNHTEIYDEFYKKNMEYLDTLTRHRTYVMDNVKFYYVKASPECNAASLDEVGRMITVPGTESWCPGILKKTLASFQYVHSVPIMFDYLVRTNVSTFINIEELYNELLQVHCAHSLDALDPFARHKYIALGHISKLQHMNHGYGLNDETIRLYYNQHFFQGVCIIINYELFKQLVEKSSYSINTNIVDDVEIGRFIFSHDLYNNPNKKILYTLDLQKRMVSYYTSEADAQRPFIFCNNRYKSNRYADLNNFHNVCYEHIRNISNIV